MNLEEKLKKQQYKEIWQQYCGFLDLSMDGYMKIQRRLMEEQVKLWSNCGLGQSILKGKHPQNLDEFRKMVPLTTYDDYADILLAKQPDMLPGNPVIWIQTTWEGGKHPIKVAPYTRSMLDTYRNNVTACLILSTSKEKGSFDVAATDKFLYALAPLPFATGLFPLALGEEIGIEFLPAVKEAVNMSFSERNKLGFKMAMKKDLGFFFGLGSVAYAVSLSLSSLTNGGGGGAGIGGGNFASADNIAISGGEVTANGGDYAAGIGGGAQRSGSSIQISDGTVTAHGGREGAGIGGGYASNGRDIKISGGEVKATGGEYAAGIGGGHDGNGSDIKLSGGEITAKGGTGGAGIGGGRSGTGSDITISGDAQVKSQGGTSNDYTGAGAGIGNGGTQVKNEANKKVPVDGDEVEPDTSGLTENGRLEYYAPGADMENDAPKKVIENKPEASAPSGASAPVYSVTDKDGNAVSYTAAREGSVLTIRVDAAYARLTLTADEAQALTAQSVEKVIFVTTSATSAFRPADLTAYASEAPFVLTHDGETVTFTAGETDLASLLLQA